MKKRNLLILLSILAVSFLIIGISFAYFSANIVGRETESTIITTGGILEITYSEGDNNIIVENIYPRSEAWLTKTFTLTGTNTTDLKMDYRIGIEIEENTFPDNAISYELTNNNPTNGIAVERMSYLNGTGKKYFGTGEFDTGRNIEHIYTLKLYLKDSGINQNESQEKTIRAKIFIEEDGTGGIKSPAGWYEAGNNTLLSAIRKKQSSPNRETDPGFTKAGQEISITDEGLLATEDDYGTSYYYRGAVEDNYVVFANKCWKIVRVDGNGNIKLFLWNNNGNDCNTNTTPNTTFNIETYIRSVDNVSANVFSTASGVGFMYGKPDANIAFSDNNTGAQDNINDSTILTSLKQWYDLLNNSYTSILSDVIWCGDKSFYDGPGYAQNTDADKVSTYFSATRRLTQNPKEPTLICANAGVDGKVSRYTAYDTINGNGLLNGYKVGLLTADEVAYAGGVYNIVNNLFYLYTNTTYWTMTPSHFNGNYPRVWTLDYSGFMLNWNGISGRFNLRPSISLIPTVTITTGDGTVNNPYVISVYE